MLPVFLDVSRLRILFIGQGEEARERLRLLRSFGADNVMFYDRLVTAEAMLKSDIVLIAGLEQSEARRIAELARSVGKLVNVEDDPAYCDFYYASAVNRGDLTIAVGTNGKSPTLAKLISHYIGQLFDDRWGEWVAKIGEAREAWRVAGDDKDTVATKTHALIAEENMQPIVGTLREDE